MKSNHIKSALKVIIFLVTIFEVSYSVAGPLDPKCTAEKAVKGAVAKATVGVGGRCSPGEAVKDTAKKVTGIEDKDKSADLTKGAVKKIVK